MHLLFDLLSCATDFLLRISIITHSLLLRIDVVCGHELVVLLDVEKGSNMCSKEMLTVCLIELAV